MFWFFERRNKCSVNPDVILTLNDRSLIEYTGHTAILDDLRSVHMDVAMTKPLVRLPG